MKSFLRTYMLFIFFLFIAISCGNRDNAIDNYCSRINLNGSCKDGKSCIKGICLYTCNETLKCPTKDYHCDNNICYDTTKYCSKNNFFGKCKTDSETCVEGICKNLSPCSVKNPKGICSSENRFCYNGICVDKTSECRPWNKNGDCPSNYYCNNIGKCQHNKVKPNCSLQYPKGKCFLDSEICINGICLEKDTACKEDSEFAKDCPSGQDCEFGKCVIKEDKICSIEYLFGFCENKDESCFNGKCYNLVKDCSVTDKYGKCSTGMICNDGVCEKLLIECDSEKQCPDLNRQHCENNKCLDNPIFCEDGAMNGLCPENESCVDGTCITITEECSLSNTNGKCNALNLKCINGECLDTSQEGVCSENNLNGKCPSGQTCNDGLCEGNINSLGIGNSCLFDDQCQTGLYCEKTFLDGYCTKNCIENSECDDDSGCYMISDAKGYCLAKCSVNIPNSCDRANSENYICYPSMNNDGVCLYDCKYHHCFETGRNCNAITGICE